MLGSVGQLFLALLLEAAAFFCWIFAAWQFGPAGFLPFEMEP